MLTSEGPPQLRPLTQSQPGGYAPTDAPATLEMLEAAGFLRTGAMIGMPGVSVKPSLCPGKGLLDTGWMAGTGQSGGNQA